MVTHYNYEKYKKHHNNGMRNRKLSSGVHQKFVAVSIENGKKTTAITLSGGRVAIGDDVWRMSNRADICEYPFKIVNKYEFDEFYKKEEASYSFRCFEPDNRAAV